MDSKVNIAVVGATGLVGSAVLERLAQRDFPLANVYPLASRNEGVTVDFGKRKLTVHALDTFDFTKVQLAFFCVPASIATAAIPQAVQAGCIVIDHSPAFREDKSVPLILADINSEEIADHQSAGIIACPDSSTAHVMMALQPLLENPIDSITVHAMRAVSDLGRGGIDELSQQSIALFNLKAIKSELFTQQIAFNILPQARNDVSLTKSVEEGIAQELKEFISQPDIKLQISAVQVPVFFGHSYRLLIEFKEKINMDRICAQLQKMRNIRFAAASEPGFTVNGLNLTEPKHELLIDQILISDEVSNKLALWMVADNVHCGVTTNSVHIAEILVKDYL